MILPDREIRLALQRGRLAVSPPPPLEFFDSTAIDLRLDWPLSIWRAIAADPSINFDPCFRPGAPNFSVTNLIRSHAITHDLRSAPYRIEPRGFLLGWAREKIRLPHDSRICARVEGKSSLARIGLGVHVTAPTIHAGFGAGRDAEGDALQLEIWNVGPLPIELCYEMRVCQLVFEEVHGTPEKGYGGQFRDQGPKPP